MPKGASEPRRSGRATKGQHPKKVEEPTAKSATPPATTTTTPAPTTTKKQAAAAVPAPAKATPGRKKRNTRAAAAAEAENEPEPEPEPSSDEQEGEDSDDGEIIRCICGADKDEGGRQMIQCDSCNVWQHSSCMEIPTKKVPDEYFCELCKPEFHQELLEKIARGERPWERRGRRKGRRSMVGKAKPKTEKDKGTPKQHEVDDDAATQGTIEETPKPETREGTEKGTAEPEEKEEEEEEEVENEDEEDGEEDKAEVKEEEADDEEDKVEDDEEEEEEEKVEDGEEEKVDDEEEEKVEDEEEEEEEKVEDEEEEENKDKEEDKEMGGMKTEEEEFEKIEQEAAAEAAEEQKEEDEEEVAVEEEVKEEEMKDATPEETEAPTEEDAKEEKSSEVKTETADENKDEDVVMGESDSKEEAPKSPEKVEIPIQQPTSDSDKKSMSKEHPKRKAESLEKEPAASAAPPPKETKPKEKKTPGRRASVSHPQKSTGRKPSMSGQMSPTSAGPPPMKKTKTQSDPPQTEMVKETSELRSEFRRKAVDGFVDFLKKQMKGSKHIAEDEKDHAEFAKNLAIEIEHYTFMLLSRDVFGEPNDEYRQKIRSIMFNLKKNATLCNSVLSKKISTKDFSKLSSDQMATDDIMKEVEEARRQSELQNTIINDNTGPRIRRTHKGEEIVGEDTGMAEEYSSGFIGASKDEGKGDTETGDASTPNGDDDTVMTDADPLSPVKSPTTGGSGGKAKKPLTINTSNQRTPHHRTSSFDIQNVWSNVEASDGHGHRPSIARPQPTPVTAHPANAHTQQLDKDIDKLLQGDGDSDADDGSEPYSPKDYEEEEDNAAWRGKLVMRSISEFEAQADFVGGPDLSSKIPWSEVIGNRVEIDGRIKVGMAKDYLCALRIGSRSSDLLAFTITPGRKNDSKNEAAFNKFYTHFRERQRYGVIGKPSWKGVKDAYIVVVDKDEDIPEFVHNMNFPPTPRERNLLLLCIVFARNWETLEQGHPPPLHSPPIQQSNQYNPPDTSRWQPQFSPTQQQQQQQQSSYQSYPQHQAPYGQPHPPYSPPPPQSAAGMPAQPVDFQYQPPGLKAHSPPLQREPSRENIISTLVKQINLKPEEEKMLWDIANKHPEAAHNPEQLGELLTQYLQSRGQV